MKKILHWASSGLGLLFVFISAAACGGSTESKNSDGISVSSEGEALSEVFPVSYEGVASVSDMEAYAAEVRKDGVNNDDPVENGIVSCPWFSLEVNGIEVPVYSTRCGLGVHSFAWIDAGGRNAEKSPLLDVSLTAQTAYKSVVVLPESTGVAAELSEKTVRARIESYGSFSFVFDRKPDYALTLYVAPDEEMRVPEGWDVRRLSPKRYTREETAFSDSRTAYVFEAGRYEITSISVPSDSIVWFERGAYMEVYEDGAGDYYGALRSSGTQNIEIAGRGLFDFSAVQGGEAKVKGVFSFSRVTNASFSGVVSVNSNNWSLCFTDSKNVDISRCMLLGYRTFSDGIMLSDCKNSGAKHCFLRTGDDAVETKSTGASGTDTILYEDNAVWTDKANAYGAIYECNNEMKNVRFKNCSVGFAQPTWSPMLGVCVVQMGNNKNAVWENIFFENIEVYKNDCALVNITLRDPDGNGIQGGQAKNVYFSGIVSKRCYGFPVRIYVGSGCKLGTVYLDGISHNGKLLEEEDIDDSDIISVENANASWSKKRNVKINTLADE